MVADGYFHLSAFRLPAADADFGFCGRVFDGVVHQVAQDVAEVDAVGGEDQLFRFDVERDLHGLSRFQPVLFDEGGEESLQADTFRMEAERLAPFHAHGEDLLDQPTQPLQLFLADAQVFLPESLCRIQQEFR